MDSPVDASAHNPDLSVDHELALRVAARRLAEEFRDTIAVETIDACLQTAYDQCSPGATVPNFVPLLAERFAREQLQTLARDGD